MTTATLSYKAVQNKAASINLFKVNWKIVFFSGILLCFSMLVFYVFSVNQLTGGTYLIKNYNKEIGSLLKENKILENNFAEAGFLGGIQNKTKELNFEKTTKVTYVQILDNSLAKASESSIK